MNSHKISKSSAVSPGKPTITLLLIPASGRPSRIRSIKSRKDSGSPKRRIRRSTGGDACWNGRSKYGTTPGRVTMASSSEGRISAGCR